MRPLLRVFARSAINQVRHTMARSMMRFVVFIQPIIFVTISHFMFGLWGSTESSEYVIFGTGVMTLWMTCLWSSVTDVNRERATGTLELLLISPVPFPISLLGKILGNTFLGMFTIFVSYVYSTVVLGVSLVVADPWKVALGLAATVFSFAGVSLFLALLFLLSREANLIANGLSFPVYLVSGLYFPLSSLPAGLQYVGLTLPIAWARETIRWAVMGSEATRLWTSSFGSAIAGLFVTGVAYLLLSTILFNLVFERLVRRKGRLGMA